MTEQRTEDEQAAAPEVPLEEGDPEGWRKARGVFRSDVPAEVLIRRLRDGDDYNEDDDG